MYCPRVSAGCLPPGIFEELLVFSKTLIQLCNCVGIELFSELQAAILTHTPYFDPVLTVEIDLKLSTVCDKDLGKVWQRFGKKLLLQQPTTAGSLHLNSEAPIRLLFYTLTQLSTLLFRYPSSIWIVQGKLNFDETFCYSRQPQEYITPKF